MPAGAVFWASITKVLSKNVGPYGRLAESTTTTLINIVRLVEADIKKTHELYVE